MRDRIYNRFVAQHGAIRALYVLPSGGFGGIERQAAAVLPRLGGWGIDVIPLVGPSPTLPGWLADAGLGHVAHSETFATPLAYEEGLARLFAAHDVFRGACAVRDEVERLIHERAIDVVLAATPAGWVAATEPARRFGIPVVWWAGGVPGSMTERSCLRGWAALHKPDLVIAASEAICEALRPLVHAPFEVVPGGIDLNHFRLGRRVQTTLRPPGAVKVVAMAGRLIRERRPEEFVEMAARVSSRHADVHFLIAGDGPRQLACEEMARSRGLEGRLTCLGYLEDPRQLYAACDVVALPAHDGVSTTALEAMAMRVPLVAPENPAGHDRDDATTFPAGDGDAFAAAVERVLDDPAGATERAAAASERVRREFDAHRTARVTARLLHTAVTWSGPLTEAIADTSGLLHLAY